MNPVEDAVTAITELFQKELNIKVPSSDTDLIEEGLLDSLMLVSLIMHLESQYGITVAFEDIELDNFRTVNAIEHFVSSRTS